MERLKIEYLPIEDLKEYPNNAKIHTEEQIEQIKKSIEEFGFNDPIAIWKDEIVEGHGRLIAAQELGIKELPVIRLDSLTDEQRKAYALVHNKLTMNTGFDFELLNLELEAINIDMEVYGFDINFVITARFKVEDPDRELEINETQNNMEKYLYKKFGCPCMFNSMSCEHIAKDISDKFEADEVEVLEDGFGGALYRRNE